MVPLFDTLAHPTVNGTWLDDGHGNSFSALQKDLEESGFLGACAVGLSGVDEYQHEAFSQACRNFPSLVPIAGFSPRSESVTQELKTVKRLGFRGIKIHPRFSSLNLERDSDLFIETLRGAAREDLVVFLCTYNHTKLSEYPDIDPFYMDVAASIQVVTENIVRHLDAATIEWLRAQAATARRTCSVCTGAFLLAAAGILAGKRAATHKCQGCDFNRALFEIARDLIARQHVVQGVVDELGA